MLHTSYAFRKSGILTKDSLYNIYTRYMPIRGNFALNLMTASFIFCMCCEFLMVRPI